MPRLKAKPPAPGTERVAVEKLRLDPHNPRLGNESLSQEEILEILWREFAVDEIALSIAANGYFQYEPLFAEKEGGHFTVIEGNRRLAAVLLLRDAEARQRVGATDLPKLTKARRDQLATLPVIECQRSQIWQFVGFRHVNGVQAWRSYSKAQYIAWVRNKLGIELDEIARQIGDQHATVRRLYRALMALDQAERAGVFSLDDRAKRHFSFSHLYTGLDYGGIQKYAGLSKTKSFTKTPITSAKIKQFGELCEWLYGSKKKNKPPVVRSQNPDLRLLDEVLQSRNGTAALRRGLPLQVSLDIAKGDEALLRESLVGAKRALQEARGKLVTGYHGEADLMEIANDIQTLASSIYGEMAEARKEVAKKVRKRSASKK